MTAEHGAVRVGASTPESASEVVGDIVRLTSAAVALLWRARRASRRAAAPRDARGRAAPDPIGDGVHLGRASSSSR